MATMSFLEARNRAVDEALKEDRAATSSDDPVVYVDCLKLHGEEGEVETGAAPRPIRAEVVRPGTDVSVVAVSAQVPRALRVAEKLAAEGISVEVVDARIISPLDA